MARIDNYQSYSETETLALGKEFGKGLAANSLVCFYGDLGAGKTTFIKGVVQGAAALPMEEVNSPTFVYLNIYKGTQTIYHFDLYRLRDADEFLSMGFEELFDAGGICCIEWSERIASLLPEGHILVKISHQGQDKRHIQIICEGLNHDTVSL